MESFSIYVHLQWSEEKKNSYVIHYFLRIMHLRIAQRIRNMSKYNCLRQTFFGWFFRSFLRFIHFHLKWRNSKVNANNSVNKSRIIAVNKLSNKEASRSAYNFLEAFVLSLWTKIKWNFRWHSLCLIDSPRCCNLETSRLASFKYGSWMGAWIVHVFNSSLRFSFAMIFCELYCRVAETCKNSSWRAVERILCWFATRAKI
jgi:hypothetical protein